MIYQLSAENAAAGRPVRFRGVVLCYDREWGQFYFHDGLGVNYLPPAQVPEAFEQGQYIEIGGKTCLTDGKPALTNLTARVLERRDVPAPRKIAAGDLGMQNGAWVEIAGLVRVVETSRGRLGLVIHDGQSSFCAWVMGKYADYPFQQLSGCLVRVPGIAQSSAVHDSLAGTVMVAGVGDIVTLSRAKVKPADLPVQSIDSLLTRELGPWTNDLIRVQGTIAAHTAGQSVLVKDPTGTLRGLILQSEAAQLHQRINLWGYLAITTNGVVLRDASFEVLTPPRWSGSGLSVGTPSNPDELLTTVSAIMRIPRERLGQKYYPVRLRGTITYADPEFRNHFLQDSSDAIYLDTSQANLHPGQFVEITGRADPGGYMPQISDANVVVLGATNLPRAVAANLDDLANGHLDSHWIEVEGIVRKCSLNDRHLRLVLTSPRGRFNAIVPRVTDQELPTKLIDANVKVAGACSSSVNARGQLTGVTLNVPSMDHITRVGEERKDVFSVETLPISMVSVFDSKRVSSHRIKVAGTVTYRSAMDGFYLQDDSGGIRVLAAGAETFEPGDRVEVLGFPALGGNSPLLEEALARKTGVGDRIVPRKTRAENILRDGTVDGCVVELEARLMQDAPRSATPRFVLQDGSVMFTAHLPNFVNRDRLTELTSGTLLHLKGVCVVQTSETQAVEGFRLLLNRSEDVQVIHRPPWWTAKRMLTLVGILFLLTLLALAWIISLRRQVRRQTEEIRLKLIERQAFAEQLNREKQLLATLIEHQPEQVFARDTQGKFLVANQHYCSFHGLPPPEELPGRSLSELFPETVAWKTSELDHEIFLGGRDLLEDEKEHADATGKVRWLQTLRVPLKDGQGKVAGVLGISRDITERKRAEVELERVQHQLREASRRAGMAEIATSVLHNVGNVLNSVNVSAGVIADQVRESRALKVKEVSSLFNKHAGDLGRFLTEDPKGRQLPAYLEAVSESLANERKAMLGELESLSKNIEHIKEIVAMQQTYAKCGGVVETVPVAELVEDALRIHAGALQRHNLEIQREYDPGKLPQITVERHKVLQILVNLIQNAKYACDASGRSDKLMSVRVTNGDGRVRISIEDNGVGIPPENMTRIFNHGFTTRKAGHGFGLHSCALAAKELAGTLQAHSEGPGKGARFTLELPAMHSNT